MSKSQIQEEEERFFCSVLQKAFAGQGFKTYQIFCILVIVI